MSRYNDMCPDGAPSSSEMSVTIYQSTERLVAERLHVPVIFA